MLSTQATETIEEVPMHYGGSTGLEAPMCAGDSTSDTTVATTLLTTLAAPLVNLGSSESACTGAGVNCTAITDQKGATIISPLLLGLTGMIGQIWALVYLHCGTRRQNQRTVFYLLLCILIWTDFFGKILVTPPAIISYSYKTWIGGKPMCDFHGLCMVFICLLTHFTVAAMAVERFLGICHGYFYSRNVTPSRCKMLFCGIWMFCLAFGVLPLLNVGRFYLQYPRTWCFTNIHLCPETSVLEKIYTTTIGVLNVTNIIIIVVCNVVVVGSLLRMRITPHKAFQEGQPNRSRKKNEQELQMVIVLIVITCVFVISWAPFDVILVTNQAWGPHGNSDHFQELIAIRLCSINQIVDPFVYIISRVIFRSRFWKCCHRTIMGRGWSRRGDGGNHFPISSFLQSRKFSRTQSPPKDQIPTVTKDLAEDGTPCYQKERTTRAPSIQKSHYSDSGTGSCSGMDTPLVEKLEEQPFSSETLQNRKRTTLERSLAKSLSVAIPIPLFKSEQYRVAERGKEDVAGCSREVFYLVDSTQNLLRHRASKPDNCTKSQNLATEQTPDISVITVHGCEDSGIIRSNSWGCRSTKPQSPQYRTQSTQTLAYGIYKDPEYGVLSIETPKVTYDTQIQIQTETPSQESELILQTEVMLPKQEEVQRASTLSLLEPSAAYSHELPVIRREDAAEDEAISESQLSTRSHTNDHIVTDSYSELSNCANTE